MYFNELCYKKRPVSTYGRLLHCAGPAPEGVTKEIFNLTKTIKEYKICPTLQVDISKLGIQEFQVDGHTFTVEVIDSVADYVEYMKEIFDFAAIKDLIHGSNGQKPLNVLINAMNGGNSFCFSLQYLCILYLLAS